MALIESHYSHLDETVGIVRTLLHLLIGLPDSPAENTLHE